MTEAANTENLEQPNGSRLPPVSGYIPNELQPSQSSGVAGSSGLSVPHDCGAAGRALNVAYADPPYIGQAKKHYSHDPQCAEVDHKKLITLLDMYDGWALSCSSPSLQEILAMCPKGVRVGAWVKPFCAFKVNVNPAYAWEPVIFKPARKRTRQERTVRDWVSEGITLKRGLTGVKPEKFCWWLFEVLGMKPCDALADIYPGSGAVTKAWNSWQRQLSLNIA